jgi:fructose-specific component phosphotransferase system IIB-like protein
MIFEHGRVCRHLAAADPGLLGKHLPLFQQEALRAARAEGSFHPLAYLYLRLALGMKAPLLPEACDAVVADCLQKVTAEFDAQIQPGVPVEASAELVHRLYAPVAEACLAGGEYQPLKPPFGRRLAPELVGAVDGVWERRAVSLQRRLLKKGLQVYRADVRRALALANGVLSPEELAELIRRRQPDAPADPAVLMRVLDDAGVAAKIPEVQGQIFWYPEWDVRSGDYLLRHARVAEREAGGTDEAFYQGVLTRYAGMLGQLRRSFELLRPEGLVLLRRWREGDSFDYRALLEYAVDRHMGIMPSQRIYIKRLKQLRDVAVLLLVDLSRSTANLLPDGHASVLDVEKEAIVLFCEALQKSGDRFAVAAFCSMTRFAVEYLRVKDFDGQVDADVMGRMGALAARGRTRMGAAVRHAAEQLKDVAARVRLLVVLSDGFPNDSDYKGDYAIADAGRAVSETRLAGIHVHGITVNLSDAARLDDIYGRGRHSLISDVRELPRKLPGIYRHLTK